MPRRRTWMTLRMDRSVKLTFLAVAGVSAGYLLWKWLGDDGQGPKNASSQKRKRKVVPGLLNVGNSCFMNVILQSLASCPSFVSWLDDFVKVCEKDKKHVYMAEVLLKILKILTGDTDHDLYYYDPSELLLDMSGRGWQISSDEQDAHEFFHAAMTTLLEEFHHRADNSKPLEIFQVKELLERPPNLSGIIRSTSGTADLPEQPPRTTDPSFRGTLGCVLQCQSCGYQNPVRYDSFHSLSLPLPPDLSWGMESSLYDCLLNFTSPEILRDVECISCSTMCTAEMKVVSGTESSSKQTAKGTDTLATAGRKEENVPLSDRTESHEILSNNNTISGKISDERQTLAKCEFIGNTVEIVKVETCLSHKNDEVSHAAAAGRRSNQPPVINLNLASSRQSLYNYKGNQCEATPDYIPVRRSFVRRLCIGKLPNCLCVHLQRLVWTRGTPMKRTNYVKFPDVLDLGPYTDKARIKQKKFPFYSAGTDFSMLIKNLTPREMQEALLAKRNEQGVASDTSLQQAEKSAAKRSVCLQGGSEMESTVSNSDKSSQKRTALYRLMSVIVHIGDWSFSGHFLAYRRVSEENADGEAANRWICASDSTVRRATTEEVFSCPAYMLFYERIKD